MESGDEYRISITVRDPEAQHRFAARHGAFLTSLDSLKNAFGALSSSLAGKEGDLIGIVLFYLGYLAWEDLNEILVLCANGLTTGAQKILRGMFERAVTTGYLQKHPDEAELFWNFFWVDQHKLAAGLEREFPGFFPQAKLDEISQKYGHVKGLYQVPVCEKCRLPDCKECSETRTNYTWSKKDVVTMAGDVGIPLHMIKGAYYVPMRETHPKATAIIERIKRFEGRAPKQNEIEVPFILAYGLLLAILEVLYLHFQIQAMRGPLDTATQAFNLALKQTKGITSSD